MTETILNHIQSTNEIINWLVHFEPRLLSMEV